MATEKATCSLFVGNIPQQWKNSDLEETFCSIGPIRRCIICRKDGNKRNVGYVHYTNPEHAAEALKEFRGKHIGDARLVVKPAKSNKSPEIVAPKEEEPTPKERKPFSWVNKKARIIVRNLSFKATDESIKNYFSQHGEVLEVNVLRKPNGAMIGCAFIQFAKVPSASMAIKSCNAQKFLGRPIAVDWAIPKAQFDPNASTSKIKEEPEEEDENEDEDKSGISLFSDNKPVKRKHSDSEGEENDDDDDDDYDEEESEEEDSADEEEMKPMKKKQKKDLKSDVDEGKTVFIKNLSFDSTSEDIKELFEQFGTVTYSLLCMDQLTEHPKGTAFVKFEEADSVTKCVEAAKSTEGLFLDGRRLSVFKALSREEMHQQAEERKKKDGKDNRNLFLTREGMVRPGTPAAEGVSASDMTKRLQLERWKRQMLNNLNIFVSKNRLCIHNLPPSFTDKQLRKLFLKHGGPESKITEAKVMRDMKKYDESGVAQSKEYGFVTFTESDNALQALRNINNNPLIFTKFKRPIVEFSLENRAAVNVKQKRMEKSREKNSRFEKKEKVEQVQKLKTPKKKKEKKQNSSIPSKEEISASYMGAKADPKVKTVPSHRKLMEMEKVNAEKQAQLKKSKKITRKMLKEKKQKKRTLAQVEEVQAMPLQEKKPSKKRAKKLKQAKEMKEDKQFGALVEKYKKGLESAAEKTKWYE